MAAGASEDRSKAKAATVRFLTATSAASLAVSRKRAQMFNAGETSKGCLPVTGGAIPGMDCKAAGAVQMIIDLKSLHPPWRARGEPVPKKFDVSAVTDEDLNGTPPDDLADLKDQCRAKLKSVKVAARVSEMLEEITWLESNCPLPPQPQNTQAGSTEHRAASVE